MTFDIDSEFLQIFTAVIQQYASNGRRFKNTF